jgi:hypothetical protein
MLRRQPRHPCSPPRSFNYRAQKRKKYRRVNGSRLPKTVNVPRSPPSLLYLPKA